MASEDVIELGSSDDEPEPASKKVRRVIFCFEDIHAIVQYYFDKFCI